MNWLSALELFPKSTIAELVSGGLGYGMYQNLAKTFISSGLGWSQATGLIRQVIPGFSGSMFGDIYYDQYQKVKQDDFISSYNPYDTLPYDKLIERPLGQPTKYRYIGEFTYINAETGEKEKSYKSFFSNTAMSIADAGQFLYDTFNIETYETWRQIENIKVVNIEHNEGWDY